MKLAGAPGGAYVPRMTEQPAPPPEAKPPVPAVTPAAAKEVGGPKGLEPTRYGDWERKGRCIDF